MLVGRLVNEFRALAYATDMKQKRLILTKEDEEKSRHMDAKKLKEIENS